MNFYRPTFLSSKAEFKSILPCRSTVPLFHLIQFLAYLVSTPQPFFAWKSLIWKSGKFYAIRHHGGMIRHISPPHRRTGYRQPADRIRERTEPTVQLRNPVCSIACQRSLYARRNFSEEPRRGQRLIWRQCKYPETCQHTPFIEHCMLEDFYIIPCL